MMQQSGYNLGHLVQQAQTRWLKPPEVLFILHNYEDHQLTDKPPQNPPSGSLFLFNKRILRFFRKDGHNWRRKKDGRTVGEAHERLKVGNAEALNCYYAHGELNPSFQRRSYWMLDPAYEHIVLVHYRNISEFQGSHSGESILELSPGSYSTSTHGSNSDTKVAGSTSFIEFQKPYESMSSPGSVEVSSNVVIESDRKDQLDTVKSTAKVKNSSDLEINQALRRLEEQLSLNDDSLEQIGFFKDETQNLSDRHTVQTQSPVRSAGVQDYSNSLMSQRISGDDKERYCQPFENGSVNKETAIWNDMLDCFSNSARVGPQEKHVHMLNGDAIHQPLSRMEPLKEQENSLWINFSGDNAHSSSALHPHVIEDFNPVAYPHSVNIFGANADQYTVMFDQSHIGMPLEATSTLTIAQKQKFIIREISPDWGYAHEASKVIIIGSFLCDPSDCAWTCMFGDIEVPIQIIQDGVFCCQAPPNLPGKVTLCITSGNRESCSEVREFEYRVNPRNQDGRNLPETETKKNLEEILLLVRFVQMLLFDPPMKKRDSCEAEINLLDKVKGDEDSWDQIIEALLVGSWTSSSAKDWLLQELLKEKFQRWLSCRMQEGSDLLGCLLSKKEQSIIHMVAGLGFGWALNPILLSGVNIDFRDINGWTALHWAARFGREKMVAELIASGASARAVTDPYSQDPIGRTPASIAALYGHKGLAGYLSELSLTSHLSSLTMAESELSKNSADVEAEKTVNSFSNTSDGSSADQISLKHTLAAVRNAAQAAARIQSAFRAHSFRRRQQQEASGFTASRKGDEYNFISNDVQGLSAASKLAFRGTRDYNAAALSIQKRYRGWKGRKEFLAFRKKVVKIQAHVRGHQVRKNYKVICWAVGVLEKVVLRWRRRGVGLRGFRHESESIDDTEDDDIVKVFRKQKVDVAIDEAVSRVLSMVESPDARQQYHRMLEKYHEAKAQRGGSASEEATSQGIIRSDMENDYDVDEQANSKH